MKLVLESPYKELWEHGYLVYHRKEKRRYVVLTRDSSRTRTTTQYARYLISTRLGRLLTPDEEVDRIDNDRTNDSIENLRVVTKAENLLKAIMLIEKRHGSASMYRSGCRCPQCVEYKKTINRRWYEKHSTEYNSFRRASRNFTNGRQPTIQGETQMKKEAKKTVAVKALAKTISKPQTVDVTGMKVVSVTLTENGKLVIKYTK